MASFWKALKNKFREKKDQAAEAMSDPIRDGKYAIEDSKEVLKKIKANIAKYSASIKKNKKKLAEQEKERTKWNNLAKKAAQSGDEDDARTCLVKKNQIEEEINNLKNLIAGDEKYLAQANKEWESNNAKVSRVESRHAQMSVRKQLADARSELAKGTQGLNSSSCFAELDKLEDDVMTSEAEAEAWEDMSPTDDLEDMEAKYGSAGDSAVDDELAKLMEKCNK